MEKKTDKTLNIDKNTVESSGLPKSALSTGTHGKPVKPVTITIPASTLNIAPSKTTTYIGFSDKGKGKSKILRGKGKTIDDGGDTDDLDAWLKSRQLLKPDDQLDLTEAELSEEITKVLTPKNTNVIHNLVVYSFKEGKFIEVPPAGNTVTLLKFDGTCLHIDSEEAKRQVELTGEMGYPVLTSDYGIPDEKHKADSKVDAEEAYIEEEEQEGEEEEQAEYGDRESELDVGEEEIEEEEDAKVDEEEEQEPEHAEEITDTTIVTPMRNKKNKLINQFNSCERGALTYTYAKRAVETQTIPPPRSQYSNNVLQWTIYDSYAEDYELQQKEKDKKEDRKVGQRRDDGKPNKIDKAILASKLNEKYLHCWQILERMINQNIYNDIAFDYRYWDDPADEYREIEGTLLPLWKFQYDGTKKMNVTHITFSPEYYDLFAVCFGSHDFMKQPNEGAICLFTVKNPSYPDYIISTESGVMSCDIHTKYPFLVAVGLYDGNVAVYDLKDYKKPLYVSMGETAKHDECVCNVIWRPDMDEGEINFYSLSTSGHVCHWVLMQNQLMVTTTMTLFLEDGLVREPEYSEIQLMNFGSSMTFHPVNPEIFFVGTQCGYIYKCSTEFSSKYLMQYKAHHLSVYSIDFNRFNSNIFISCGADWHIKVWEDMRPEPLLIFDLGSAVSDVKWAPYSSTVFAAATYDGKVHIFDLNVNKYQPICVQAIVPKQINKLTHITFNEKLPYIVVGDERGVVTSLKLSPNLRLKAKPPKRHYVDQTTLQIQKLDTLLSLVRELPEGMSPVVIEM